MTGLSRAAIQADRARRQKFPRHSGLFLRQVLSYGGGAAGCVLDLYSRALSIPKGAVPGLARGLGHMAPTYIVGSRDRYPTAIAAPRL
jgi:hypothetical protein